MNTETKSFTSRRDFVDEWITADHGILDARGRAIGGRAIINQPQGHGSVAVQIVALRDGITHGASRRRVFYPSAEIARAAALKRLELQGKRYRAQFERELDSVPTNATPRDRDGGRLTDEDGIDGPFDRRMERVS